MQQQYKSQSQSPKAQSGSPKAQQGSPKAQSPKAQSPKAQPPVVQFLRSLFKNKCLSLSYVLPQVLDIAIVDRIMDKSFLSKLEYQYEKFLEANMQILDLYNVIDYLLDVRDAILLKLNRMIREENKRKHNEGVYVKSQKKNPVETKILIEYKCGCQNLIHYNPSFSSHDSSSSSSHDSSSSPSFSSHDSSSRHHCLDHLKLLKRQSILENELKNVKDELQDATARQNIRSINYCK